METQKFQKPKPGLDKNHYEKQLLRTHRKEVNKYLIDKNYCFEDRKQILQYYDRKVDLKNIIQLHTHETGYFLYQLCTGNIENLIKNSTSKVL